MLRHREELALLETLDMGKPIADSMAVDIPSSANCIRWYGEAVDKIYDEVAPTGPGVLATIEVSCSPFDTALPLYSTMASPA